MANLSDVLKSKAQVLPNKVQTKFLTADTTAGSGLLGDLAFNNLVIGKRYEYYFSPNTIVSGTGDSRYNMRIINSDTSNTNIVGHVNNGEGGGSNFLGTGGTIVGEFTAVDTNLNVY